MDVKSLYLWVDFEQCFVFDVVVVVCCRSVGEMGIDMVVWLNGVFIVVY